MRFTEINCEDVRVLRFKLEAIIWRKIIGLVGDEHVGSKIISRYWWRNEKRFTFPCCSLILFRNQISHLTKIVMEEKNDKAVDAFVVLCLNWFWLLDFVCRSFSLHAGCLHTKESLIEIIGQFSCNLLDAQRSALCRLLSFNVEQSIRLRPPLKNSFRNHSYGNY